MSLMAKMMEEQLETIFVSPTVIKVTDYLLGKKQALGSPTRVETEKTWELLDDVIRCWHRLFLKTEVADFIHDMEIERAEERDVRSAVQANGGYFPIVYPPKLYGMMRTIFPEQKWTDKEFIRKFTKRYPLFKATNYTL